MSEQTEIKAPPGWGDDPLSEFFSIGTHNEFATFAAAPSWHKALSAIAADLLKCSDYAISNVLKSDDPSALLLFMAAHNHYLAAARLAESGQCLPAYPTGRAALESALYGWYLAGNPDAAGRWHNKPTDRTALRAWNAEFKFSKLASTLSETSQAAAKWAKYLHQTAIDFGAHPNKEALYSNMSHKRLDDGAAILQMTFLHKWQSFSISTTKFVIETGMFAVSIFARAYPEADKLHRLSAASAEHASNLSALVKQATPFVEQDLEFSSSPP